MKNRLLFVINVDWFFISHRLPVAKEALAQGYEVHIACGDTGCLKSLTKYGFVIHKVAFTRARVSLLQELGVVFELLFLLLKIRPNIVHAITIKPSLYVGILTRILGINSLVIAVSGLGLVFVAKGKFASVRRWLVKALYRFAINPKKTQMIFQNATDYKTLQTIVNSDKKNLHIILGSGVDLDEFTIGESAGDEKFVVCLAARLLREKGVYEFVEAAQRITKLGSRDNLVFRIVGGPDEESPSSVSLEEIEKWSRSGIVECPGFQSDMASELSKASVVVLPSFYGEGLPKVLIEAAACGKPIITSNSPGCRDSIIEGKTGLLVPPKDVDALCEAILYLVENPQIASEMGAAGRVLAEERYCINAVVKRHLEIYAKSLEI